MRKSKRKAGKMAQSIAEVSANGAVTSLVEIKTVAFVGHAPSTRMMAPFAQGDIEVWTMNDAFAWIPRADRWFEIHTKEVYEHPARRTAGYLEFLAQFQGPIYMQFPDLRLPSVVPYDIEKMIVKYGNRFSSSFAWMFAQAVEDGFKRIEIYGCDLAGGTEYAHQREATAWWIGYCEGRGIEVYLPPGCPLLSEPPYAVPRTLVQGISPELIDNRAAEIRKAQAEAAAELNKQTGRLEEYSYWRSKLEGVVVPHPHARARS